MGIKNYCFQLQSNGALRAISSNQWPDLLAGHRPFPPNENEPDVCCFEWSIERVEHSARVSSITCWQLSLDGEGYVRRKDWHRLPGPQLNTALSEVIERSEGEEQHCLDAFVGRIMDGDLVSTDRLRSEGESDERFVDQLLAVN